MRKKVYIIVRLNAKPNHFSMKKYEDNPIFFVLRCLHTDVSYGIKNEPVVKYYDLLNFKNLGWDMLKERFYNNKEYKDAKQIWRM